MLKPEKLEGLVNQLLEIIPPQMGQAPEVLKSQIKSYLQNSLTELDLVTRDEFEVQKQVLAKTRAKLEELEKKLNS